MMNWKVICLMFLVFFASAVCASMALTSVDGISNSFGATSLNVGGVVQPTGGDPIDNPVAPC